MKKIKRMLALALAVVMTMAMSTVAFAAQQETTIKVNGTKEGTTFTYAKVIQEDNTTRTGWDIVDTYVSAFKDKFGNNETDEQNLIDSFNEATETDRIQFLSTITTSETFSNNGTDQYAAGLYVINPSDPSGEYVYQTLGVAVGYTYGETDGVATIQPQTVNAKGTKIAVEKSVDDTTTEVGKTLTFTIQSNIPVVDENLLSSTVTSLYSITDTLTGADYVTTNDKVTVNVYVQKDETQEGEYAYTTTKEATVTANDDGTKSITVDLTDIATEKATTSASDDAAATSTYKYAGKDITLTYQATVTDEEVVSNTAYPNVNNVAKTNQGGTSTSYLSPITITKIDNGSGDAAKNLEGAKFVICKDVTENDQTVTYYATIDTTGNVNKLTGWTKDKTSGKDFGGTEVTTGTDGTVTVEGFDAQDTYYIQETEAPEGYSLNSTTPSVTFTKDATNTDNTLPDEAIMLGAVSLADTTLTSLPFTGGMGTTLFTVLGVAIMVVAAALYFASKKKNNNK